MSETDRGRPRGRPVTRPAIATSAQISHFQASFRSRQCPTSLAFIEFIWSTLQDGRKIKADLTLVPD
jgi:hypothetical protein